MTAHWYHLTPAPDCDLCCQRAERHNARRRMTEGGCTCYARATASPRRAA